MQSITFEQLHAKSSAVLREAEQPAGDIHESIEDTKPNISHDEVMAEMEAEIRLLEMNSKK